MTIRLLAVTLAALVAVASPAAAGHLTCTRSFESRSGPTNPLFFHVAAVGECTLSTSYAIGGDTFSGSGTPVQNAGAALCGQSTDVPVFVATHAKAGSFQPMFAYDYSAGAVGVYTPTHSASATDPIVGSASFTGSLSFTGNSQTVNGTNSAVTCNAPPQGGSVATPVGILGGAWANTGLTDLSATCVAPTFTGSGYTPTGSIAVTDPSVSVALLQSSINLSQNVAEEVPAGFDLSAQGVVFRYLAFCN